MPVLLATVFIFTIAAHYGGLSAFCNWFAGIPSVPDGIYAISPFAEYSRIFEYGFRINSFNEGRVL
jgi:hypothetical protein